MAYDHRVKLKPETAQWIRDIAVVLLPSTKLDLEAATAVATSAVLAAMDAMRAEGAEPGIQLATNTRLFVEADGTWVILQDLSAEAKK